MTSLKVVGIDVTSIGRCTAQGEADTEIAIKDADRRSYRKLVISDGKIVGAILLGYPQQATLVNEAIKTARDVSGCLDELRAGNWDVLRDAPSSSAALPQPKHNKSKSREQVKAHPERPPRSRQPAVRTTESIKNSFRVLTFHFGGEPNPPPAPNEELRGHAELGL